jgi:hypothetical protein
VGRVVASARVVAASLREEKEEEEEGGRQTLAFTALSYFAFRRSIPTHTLFLYYHSSSQLWIADLLLSLRRFPVFLLKIAQLHVSSSHLNALSRRRLTRPPNTLSTSFIFLISPTLPQLPTLRSYWLGRR